MVPAGAKALFAAVATRPHAAQRAALIDALVGTSQLAAAGGAAARALDATGPALHTAVAELLAGETTFEAPTLALARAAVLDSDARRRHARASCSPRSPRCRATRAAMRRRQIFARLHAASRARRRERTIRSRRRGAAGSASGCAPASSTTSSISRAPRTDPAQRTLAYAVLLQAVRNPRAPAAMREKVAPVLDAAWADAALAPRLVDAITIMRVESQYAEQLKAYQAAAGKK